MQLRGPTALLTIARAVVTAVNVGLAETPYGEPDRACVVPGEVAWDDCDCGLLAATVRRWELSDSFPDASATFGERSRTESCVMPWIVATIELQLIRCAPSPVGNAVSVNCAALDGAAAVLLSDAHTLIAETDAVLCEMKSNDQIVDFVIGDQQTLGPDGGCVGIMLNVQVSIER